MCSFTVLRRQCLDNNSFTEFLRVAELIGRWPQSLHDQTPGWLSGSGCSQTRHRGIMGRSASAPGWASASATAPHRFSKQKCLRSKSKQDKLRRKRMSLRIGPIDYARIPQSFGSPLAVSFFSPDFGCWQASFFSLALRRCSSMPAVYASLSFIYAVFLF
ncbi:hypothetical protein F2P79_005848 [Pimephales promelas]|nr:hypothetical protein F2P79_005848 [Pimephales promelas]